MAKAISQSDTKWVKKGEKLPSGKIATKGQLVQISTGKTYTGKVKIESIGSTAYNPKGIAEYKGGKNVAISKSKPAAKKATAQRAATKKTPAKAPAKAPMTKAQKVGAARQNVAKKAAAYRAAEMPKVQKRQAARQADVREAARRRPMAAAAKPKRKSIAQNVREAVSSWRISPPKGGWTTGYRWNK